MAMFKIVYLLGSEDSAAQQQGSNSILGLTFNKLVHQRKCTAFALEMGAVLYLQRGTTHPQANLNQFLP